MFVSCAVSAQEIERKIIIQNNHFYYTTIDAEFQIATLHVGNVSEGLKTAKLLALPAGRNYSDPVNPFSWDVLKEDFYAINFLNHPLNDRNEALKRIKINSLTEWNDKTTVLDMVMRSTDLSPFAYNDPYSFVIKRSNTLNNFFYDGVASDDSTYCMAITNNGEMSIWIFKGAVWQHSEIQKIPVDGFFSIFNYKKSVCMILNNGQTYEYSTKTNSLVEGKNSGVKLSDGILIVNKDDNTIKYLKDSQLDRSTPLNELIKKKAIEIF